MFDVVACEGRSGGVILYNPILICLCCFLFAGPSNSIPSELESKHKITDQGPGQKTKKGLTPV